MKLLLATHNGHKRREFQRLLVRPGSADAPAGGESWELDMLPDEVTLPPEDGETFAANALGKARAAAQAMGWVTIADDSGICAAALAGAPGVRSARYAGEGARDAQNLEKLLHEVPAGSPLEYVCVIAYVDPVGGIEQLFEGCCRGRLAAQPRGERGFGYDPAFVPDEQPPPTGCAGVESLTMAELSDQQKDAISHRGRAVRGLLRWLEEQDVVVGGGRGREEAGQTGV